MLQILISGDTDVGKQRNDNQDTFICERLWGDDTVFIAAIDGVGGYAGGEKAAAIAKESLLHYMSVPKGDTLTMLREAMVFANNEIVEARTTTGFHEMCCVMTAAVASVKTGRFYFAHVGDTRLYRYDGRQLKKITSDHSLVGIREDAGDITEEEAMADPQRNIILREAGSAKRRIDDPDFLEYGEHDFSPGDELLVCSDGLSDMITAEQIARILANGNNLDKQVKALIRLANESGGRDNITAVIARNNASPSEFARKKPNGILPGETRAKRAPELQNTGEPQQPKKNKTGTLLILCVLLAVTLGSIYWYSDYGSKTLAVNPSTDTSTINATKKNIFTADTTSGLALTNPSSGNRLPGAAGLPDTLSISSPANIGTIKALADKSNSFLVLVPTKDRGADKTALEIDIEDSTYFHNDSITISNLHIRGFKTGIKVTAAVQVVPANLVFENVTYPFSFEYKPDSLRHKGRLVISPRQP